MGPLRRLLAPAALALAATVGVLLLGRASSASPAGDAPPLAVTASFAPAVVGVGDPVTARVTVRFDTAAIDGRSLRLDESLAPLTPLGSPQVSRGGSGRLGVVTYTAAAACLSAACVSDSGLVRLTFPRVHVLAGGRSVAATLPRLEVRGRVTAADLARAQPPFRADRSLVPADPRLGPVTLARVLDAIAVALALVAVGLATLQTRGALRRRQARTETRDELDRALQLAREAESRPPPDRRRALGLLARLLRERERPLAGSADELAWSRPQPQPPAVAELVDQIENGSGT